MLSLSGWWLCWSSDWVAIHFLVVVVVDRTGGVPLHQPIPWPGVFSVRFSDLLAPLTWYEKRWDFDALLSSHKMACLLFFTWQDAD
jgi:hypothetical protein